MSPDPSGRPGTVVVAVTALALLPGTVAAQPVDPTAVVDAPVPVRVAGAFVLVLLSGAAWISLSESFVDRSVGVSMESPLKSLVYGVMLHIVIALIGVYVFAQLISVTAVGSPFVATGVIVVGAVWLVFAGLGLTVVGAYVTELASYRQLWPGLVVGAALGALTWLLTPFAAGLVAWVVVVSLGIGGPTRRWVHASWSKKADVDVDT